VRLILVYKSGVNSTANDLDSCFSSNTVAKIVGEQHTHTHTHTITTTVLQPFVRDYLGEPVVPVPEETLTHPQLMIIIVNFLH